MKTLKNFWNFLLPWEKISFKVLGVIAIIILLGLIIDPDLGR